MPFAGTECPKPRALLLEVCFRAMEEENRGVFAACGGYFIAGRAIVPDDAFIVVGV